MHLAYINPVEPPEGVSSAADYLQIAPTRYLATLFGIVMLSHQVGGFLGAWLGGKAFEASGSYDWMWWADIALCVFAAAVHLPRRVGDQALVGDEQEPHAAAL